MHGGGGGIGCFMHSAGVSAFVSSISCGHILRSAVFCTVLASNVMALSGCALCCASTWVCDVSWAVGTDTSIPLVHCRQSLACLVARTGCWSVSCILGHNLRTHRADTVWLVAGSGHAALQRAAATYWLSVASTHAASGFDIIDMLVAATPTACCSCRLAGLDDAWACPGSSHRGTAFWVDLRSRACMYCFTSCLLAHPGVQLCMPVIFLHVGGFSSICCACLCDSCSGWGQVRSLVTTLSCMKFWPVNTGSGVCCQVASSGAKF
jgi:hypothetical protein